MKKMMLVLFLVQAMTGLYAQNDPATVNKVIVDYFEAISAQDMNRQKELTTDNYMILEHGVIWNHDTIEYKTNQLKGRSYKRINKIDFISTKIKGEMAWVAYYNRADITLDGKQRSVAWLESAVLVRKGKNWKIQLLHSTRLAPKT